jgi:hypothetical protein
VFPNLRDFSLLSCRSWRFFMPLAKASHRQKAAALYLVGPQTFALSTISFRILYKFLM